MGMEDVYQHNFRLNLNNPHQLKLHRKLLEINKDVYRSKNEYMIQKLYLGIFGTDEEVVPETENSYIVDEEAIKELEERITKKVTAEILGTVLGMLARQPHLQEQKEKEEPIDAELENAAIGYFDDWGNDDG